MRFRKLPCGVTSESGVSCSNVGELFAFLLELPLCFMLAESLDPVEFPAILTVDAADTSNVTLRYFESRHYKLAACRSLKIGAVLADRARCLLEPDVCWTCARPSTNLTSEIEQ